MRILVFIDYHNQTQLFSELSRNVARADLVICAGDMSVFEYDLEEVLARFNDWNKPVLIIHGNHEDEDTLRFLCKQYKNLSFVHGEVLVIDGVCFAFWGGGGFSVLDKDLLVTAQSWRSKITEPFVFVTHAPPFGTAIDDIGRFVGNKTIRTLIEEFKPVYHVCGHIHETAGKKDKIGSSIVINPGPCGVLLDMSFAAQK